MGSGRWFRFALIPLAALIALLFAFYPDDALAKDLHWEEYNTTIELHSDGTMTITEDQLIAFIDGVFTNGWATIPLDRVEDITNVRVFEDGKPLQSACSGSGCYSVNSYGGEIEILWWFDPVENETRHFTIQYDVIGGVRVYDDTGREQIWWRIIDSDFSADINFVTATVILPQPVPPDTLMTDSYTQGFGEDIVGTQILDDRTIRWTASGLTKGDAFEARVEFPKMSSAVEPSWQSSVEAKERREEQLEPYKALANVLFLGVGVLLVVGGPLAVVTAWHTFGRDYPVEMPIDVLREPPDELPPGAVGTLVDERADVRDMIATLVDLAERGVIHIEEMDKKILGLIKYDRDWTLHYIDKSRKLRPPEMQLIWAIFGQSGEDVVEMSDIRTRFAARQSKVRKAMYEELVNHGYFPSNPEKTRNRWRAAGFAGLGLSIGVGFLIYGSISGFAPFAIAVFIGFAVLMVAVIIGSRVMPRKTEKGALAAAQWLAFKKYLQEIERFQDVQQARELFGSYLPYAIAFGLEKSWIRKFERIGAPAPHWYGPYRTHTTGRSAYDDGPSFGFGGDVGVPSLQEVSDSFTGSLQSMSDGMFDMFNEASKVFKPYSSSGSGGFSGGGGSFGGGGGGGGRGFG